jgi:quercetin dioxygenase-like cupin family protein
VDRYILYQTVNQELKMFETTYFLDCKDAIRTSADGPHPATLFEQEKIKLVVAGLEAGQSIPPHKESLGIYHFISGEGVMTVDDVPFNVRQGSTIVAPNGAERGISAQKDLSFLGTRITPCDHGSKSDCSDE